MGSGVAPALWQLLIMGPHADDFDDFLFLQDLVDQAMLNIDAAGISARQVTHQFFKSGGSAERVFADYFQQLDGLDFETGRGQLLNILLSLFGVDNVPCHQSASWRTPPPVSAAFPDGLPCAWNREQI